MMAIITTIILFVIILGVLVLVHELGHFITAIKNGITAHEFGFGFPPRMVGFVKDEKTGKWKVIWGNKEYFGKNTMYSLNWLPLGGFVRIKGEDGQDKDPDSFAIKSIFTRFKVLIAGVTMNFILAAFLFFIILMNGTSESLANNSGTFEIKPFGIEIFTRNNYEKFDLSNIDDGYAIKTYGGQSILFGKFVFDTDEKVKKITVLKSPAVMINTVTKDYPAKESGVNMGDTVKEVCVESECVAISESKQLQSIVAKNFDNPIKMKVERSGEVMDIELTPKNENGQGIIGVSLVDVALVKYKWYEAIWGGIMKTFIFAIGILGAFFGLIKSIFMERSVAQDVSGPVGIAILVKQVKDLGFLYILHFTAMLSVNLAIINALPIPALDGGRILFLLIEKIKGEPVDEKLEGTIHTISFAALMILIAVITVSDVVKLVVK